MTHLSDDGIQKTSSFMASVSSLHDFQMKGVSPPPLETTGVSSTRIAFSKAQTLAVGEVSRLQVSRDELHQDYDNRTPSSSESPRESVLSDIADEEERDWYNDTPSENRETAGGYMEYNDFGSDSDSPQESPILENDTPVKEEDECIYY